MTRCSFVPPCTPGCFVINQMQLASQKDVHEDTLSSLARYLEQSLVLNRHNAVTKKKVADTINYTYKTIIDIMAKDTTHMGRVLEDLSQKHRSLCRDVLEAVEINQYLRENVVGLRSRNERLEEQAAATRQLQDQALKDMKARVLLIEEQGQQCIVTRHPETSNAEQRRELLPSSTFILLLGKLENLERLLEELKTETRLTKYQDVFLRIEDPVRSKCDVDHHPAPSEHNEDAWLYAAIDKLMKEISMEDVVVEEIPKKTAAAAVEEQRKVIAHLQSRLEQLYRVLQEAQPYSGMWTLHRQDNKPLLQDDMIIRSQNLEFRENCSPKTLS
ncbi:hypothetical protein PR048_003336 [Dryococelus australis]|uniref:Uncharacterized protein n=1 Tax=Dryococelus australis TaxID=614101 RepID=A0ABQ9IMQ9_9NEOP|nr:hypothetical protein PR048_003336 [Dryococelus australis]